MTKEELLDVLEKHSIILHIGDDWLITEKYKAYLKRDKPVVIPEQIAKKPVTKIEAFNTKTAGNQWPEEIASAKGRYRVRALMDACEIPAASPNGEYMLRGVDNDLINTVSNIVDTDDFNPPDFIECIKLYYKNTQMPVGFKKMICEEHIVGLYDSYISGNIPGGNSNKSNGTWS